MKKHTPIRNGRKRIEPPGRRSKSGMEALTRVKKRGNIVLPASVRQAARLEDGDFLAVRIVDDTIVLIPQKLINKSQSYFWTETWQKAEREASEDIAAGRTRRFFSVEDLIADLDRP